MYYNAISAVDESFVRGKSALHMEIYASSYNYKRNYSEPHPIHSQNRSFHELSRCFAANFAHIWGGGSIRASYE